MGLMNKYNSTAPAGDDRERVTRRWRPAAAVAAVAIGTVGVLASVASADPPSLSGVYAGTVTADFGSASALTMQASGSPTATTVSATLGGGGRIDCHGNRAVDPAVIALSGARTIVHADGSSVYELAGRFEFDTDGPLGTTVHVIVDLALHGTLSPDGRAFAGPIDVLVRPSLGENCPRQWSFSVSNDVRVVPDVIDETRAQAKSVLLAAGLAPSFRTSIDRTCNHNNTVWLTHPRAGTFVAVGSTIDVVIGVRDRSRPCP